jgi:hypothetical protein
MKAVTELEQKRIIRSGDARPSDTIEGPLGRILAWRTGEADNMRGFAESAITQQSQIEGTNGSVSDTKVDSNNAEQDPDKPPTPPGGSAVRPGEQQLLVITNTQSLTERSGLLLSTVTRAREVGKALSSSLMDSKAAQNVVTQRVAKLAA